MRRLSLISTVLLLGLALVAAATATQTEPNSAADAPASGLTGSAERGRYVVHELSMCVQCHSPRDRSGELLEDRLLTGGAIPVKSPFNGPRWAFHAPNIKNLAGYTEEQFINFMMTGIRPDGTEARAPMPPFRMNRDDAQAVYDYLTTP